MKKSLSILIICSLLVILALPMSVFAEQTEAPEDVPANNEILFRGVPWYSSKADAESILIDSGLEINKYNSDEDIYRMSGIDYTNVTSGSDRVDGGGKQVQYTGAEVAGYSPISTYGNYMYTFNEDGSLNHNEEDAEFYFGFYFLRAGDFSDYQAIYNDLSAKLSSLYGEGQSDETNYHITTTWYDSDGNQIRLLVNTDYTYVTLGYMAAEAEEKLDAVQAALDAEALAEEDANREENKDNVSGL